MTSKQFDLNLFFAGHYCIDVFFVIITDAVSCNIETIRGAFEQVTGFLPEQFVGGSYMLLLHHLNKKESKKIKNTSLIFANYLKSQPNENKSSILMNRTMEILGKDGSKLQILIQSVPIAFNVSFEAQTFLNIVTNISNFKTAGNSTNYIIDANNKDNILRIPVNTRIVSDNAIKVSDAELKVLKLMADGLSSKIISDKLFISEHTVKKHRKNMLLRCNCTSSSALVRLAMTEKWI